MRALVLSGGASHGAFQVGAIKALYEIGWIPDAILGSSVGAINAVGLASGKTPHEMCELWRNLSSRHVYEARPLREWFHLKNWTHLLDTSPLRSYMKKHVDIENLEDADQTVTCFSVDAMSGRLCTYTNHTCSSAFQRRYRPNRLDLDALMASTAIPLVFPWVRGEWDGSIRQYAPLKPAVVLGATEVVVVALEPWGKPDAPVGILQTAMRIVDVAALARMQDDIRRTRERNQDPQYTDIDLRVISPTRNLGYSKLSFSDPKKSGAIQHGYRRAFEVMDG